MYSKNQQKWALLLENNGFNQNIKRLRAKWTKGRILKRDMKSYGRWIEEMWNKYGASTDYPKQLKLDVDNLRKRLKLVNKWNRYLEEYILFGNKIYVDDLIELEQFKIREGKIISSTPTRLFKALQMDLKASQEGEIMVNEILQYHKSAIKPG